MVAIYEDDFGTNPQTLCDWVKNVRIKKIQMKRKVRRGGDLRVCAILSTALLSAEHELRRKQQERCSRWMEVQTEFESRLSSRSSIVGGAAARRVSDNDYVKAIEMAEECKQSEEITNLWKNELSGLDNFMRSMSSSGGSGHSCHSIASPIKVGS